MNNLHEGTSGYVDKKSVSLINLSPRAFFSEIINLLDNILGFLAPSECSYFLPHRFFKGRMMRASSAFACEFMSLRTLRYSRLDEDFRPLQSRIPGQDKNPIAVSKPLH